MNADSIRAELDAEGVYPLSRAQYERLVEAGVLGSDDRVELLFGRIVPMSPQGWAHAWVAEQLVYRLVAALPAAEARVRAHSPFAASNGSEPEPDVLVYPPSAARNGHPTAAFLVVEVSDTSLRKDRVVKATLYAEAGVPEYWVVDLEHRCVHVHRSPGPAGYGSIVQVGPDDPIALGSFPGVVVRVSDILP